MRAGGRRGILCALCRGHPRRGKDEGGAPCRPVGIPWRPFARPWAAFRRGRGLSCPVVPKRRHRARKWPQAAKHLPRHLSAYLLIRYHRGRRFNIPQNYGKDAAHGAARPTGGAEMHGISSTTRADGGRRCLFDLFAFMRALSAGVARPQDARGHPHDAGRAFPLARQGRGVYSPPKRAQARGTG